jgi:pimeloyl-ACP methyl ester carboxylesterase
MSNTPGIVFIHGAGLGSWIFDEVLPFIPYPVLSINFPNRNNETDANKSLSLEGYVYPIVQEINDWNQGKLVIVAHSIGGIVGLKVAEALEEKVVGFIAVSTPIPKNGGSFLSCFPFFKRIIISALMKIVGTKPPAAAIKESLCNDLTEAQTQKVINRFTPESTLLYTQKSFAKMPGATKLFIKTNEDKEISAELQEHFAENLKAANTISINSGHLPMLSQPQQFAAILNDFMSSLSYKNVVLSAHHNSK